MARNNHFQYQYDQGARRFLCGVRVAVFNPHPRCWQHRANQEGDKAVRRFLFGAVHPNPSPIKDFQEQILMADNRLELIEKHLAEFKASPFYQPHSKVQP